MIEELYKPFPGMQEKSKAFTDVVDTDLDVDQNKKNGYIRYLGVHQLYGRGEQGKGVFY